MKERGGNKSAEIQKFSFHAHIDRAFFKFQCIKDLIKF
jgi:hypothetical protein